MNANSLSKSQVAAIVARVTTSVTKEMLATLEASGRRQKPVVGCYAGSCKSCREDLESVVNCILRDNGGWMTRAEIREAVRAKTGSRYIAEHRLYAALRNNMHVGSTGHGRGARWIADCNRD